MIDKDARKELKTLERELHDRIKVLERTGLTVKNCPKCNHPVLAIADWAEMLPKQMPRIASSYRCLTCGSKFIFGEIQQLVESRMTREEIKIIKGTEHTEEFSPLIRKQEEIREVIDAHTDDRCHYPDKDCEFYTGEYCHSEDGSYKCLMKRLGELDVVIELKREPPKDDEEAWERIQEKLGGNLSVVEPLIKD